MHSILCAGGRGIGSLALIWALTGEVFARPADWSCTESGQAPFRLYSGSDYIKIKPKPKKPKLSIEQIYKLNMVRIKPGTFLMGAPPGEKRRQATEGPVQTVTIAYPFEVGKFEVTFDQWEICVDDGGCRYRPKDEGWGRGVRPAIHISFNDAQIYLKWLNRKTGRNYRLLSEAEWEYVARAGQKTPFYTGERISSGQANFNGTATYNDSQVGVYRKRTLPVGRFPPNQFGVHDILGNVLEWTQDCWSDNHVGAPNDGSARRDGDCKFRVMKGGSWVSHPYHLRAANRIKYTRDYRYEDYGFRIARTLR